MDSTSLLFRTARGDFCPPDLEYGRLSDSELEALAQQTRDAVTLFDVELEKRHGAMSTTPPNLIIDCEKKLQASLQNFKILGRLDARATKSVELAVSILTNEQTVRGSKVYQEFLHDITRHCNRGLALLCAASFGKHKIVGMNAQSRISLVYHLKSKKALLCSPTLDTFTNQYNLPTATGRLCVSSMSSKAE